MTKRRGHGEGAIDKRGEDVSSRNHEQRNVLPEALGDRYGFGKQHLLVHAEELVVKLLRSAGADHARGEHDDVLIVSICTRKSPL